MKKIYGILMMIMLVAVGAELLAQASTTVQSKFDTATTAITSVIPAVTSSPDSLGAKVGELTVLVKEMQHPTLWSIIALICVVLSVVLIVVGLFIKKSHSAALQQILQAVTKK